MRPCAAAGRRPLRRGDLGRGEKNGGRAFLSCPGGGAILRRVKEIVWVCAFKSSSPVWACVWCSVCV